MRLDGLQWTCECPDYQEWQRSCKHVAAVVEFLALTAGVPWPPASETANVPLRPTYSQDWPAYDAAQQAEHPMFDSLLWDLLEPIVEPLRPVGARGRAPIPFRVQLLCAIRKVHSMESSRRARGLLLALNRPGTALLAHVPSYMTPSRLFRNPAATPALLDLIHRSAEPLREVEEGGTVAVDSSGFCTTCRGAYCTERYGPRRTHRWLKAHLSVGTKTHIVLDTQVTDENGADAPRFLPLLQGARATGIRFAEVVADKAYLSRENLDGAAELDLNPFVPFKSNSTPKSGGSRLWRQKYLEFQLRREEFDQHYHDRSNVESTISAIKRKLGEPLLSKDPIARVNELLAKLLAYNIGVVIHEAYEHHVEVGVPTPNLDRPYAG
ncbi:transposase IS4 family protein [mine drainage metagenome]|uniref:Transposase IS4 family protein n=1 Tax=mine drainage metagenome TaxID=410659 RepID=T1A0N7_9ZZZZ